MEMTLFQESPVEELVYLFEVVVVALVAELQIAEEHTYAEVVLCVLVPAALLVAFGVVLASALLAQEVA